MTPIFTYPEGVLLIRLLIAHIIIDFLLQTDSSVKSKKNGLLKSKSFWIHGLYIILVTSFFILDKWNLKTILIITVSHLIIDYLKLFIGNKTGKQNNNKKDLWLFVIDQILHIIVILLVWLMLINGFAKCNLLIKSIASNYPILIKLLGYLIVIFPTTYFIKFLTLQWSNEVSFENNSLQNAGKWIGILERIMVVTFMFINQYAAIGFLVTAKSILRLIDKPENNSNENDKQFSSRKHTEYVLIGTFLSFGIAIIVSLFIQWLLKF